MTKPKKKTTGKKRGGQKGNANARKHGLYGKAFVEGNTLTIEERRAILDGCIARMYETFMRLDDISDMTKILNSIAMGVTAANNCERTLSLINGNYTPIEDLLNALKYLDPEQD